MMAMDGRMSSFSLLPVNPVASEPNPFNQMRPDQIECLCKALENMEKKNMGRMALFLQKFDAEIADPSHPCNETLRRTRALALFHEGEYPEFFDFIRTNHFAIEDHPLLQKLWNEAHYAEIERSRGGQQKLDPVARYRVRRRNLFPPTIWDGEETNYCFKKSVQRTLKDFFRTEQTPNQRQKLELSGQTGLTLTQISNWFKNQRQRAKQHHEQSS